MTKKNMLLFMATILIFSCTTDPKDSSKELKTYYEIAVNDEFQIDLASNPTTGYTWQLVNKQTLDIVESISQEYVSDSNPFRRSGVGGKEVWKFKGIKTGFDSLIMKYCRRWDPDSTEDSTIIKIKVR